ncbi:MAG: tetratricopeptide repeat protein [Steroidobacterales bacterium]
MHQGGRLAEAASLYEKIVAEVPRHFDAMHLLGVIALQEKRYDQAEALIRSALEINPNDGAALGNLGTVLMRAGKPDAAYRQYERAVRLQPDSDVPLANLGAVLREMGRSQDALVPLRRAFSINPGSSTVCNLLGACLLDTGDAEGATRIFEAATLADPGNADGWANLAAALNRTGDRDTALQIADKAVAMQPGSSSARSVLASVQFEKGQAAAAIATYREAVALPDPSTQTLYAFGNALMHNGLCAEARTVLSQAIDVDGNNANARWSLAMAWCEPVFGTAAEIEPARASFERGLADLRTWFQATRRPNAYSAVGCNQPFFLAYQPYNNRGLLGRYGKLCVEWMASMPSHGQPAAKPGRHGGSGKGSAQDLPIRVGFVSAHIRDHSVWNAITKGWVLHLDRQKFASHMFQLDRVSDRETEVARQAATHFVDQPNSLQTWIEAIAGANLDVLIYPEIGMDPMTAQLASLRLAPLQAAAWGHPETTGLPTMDLYLSAQDLEPEDADGNYCERLVRLPSLGVYVEPLDPEIPDLGLRELGLPRDEPLLLCPGAPFKYSPLHDAVWARIARGLHDGDGGWLVFFRSRSESMDELLEQRLRGAFDREGVDFDAHVCLIPALSRPRFFALMQRSALMLDTLGFSGFNTALQAVECGLPVLAHEGQFMRARLASAIMRKLALPELVAQTDEEFIAQAVRLAGDAPARERLSRQIESRRGILFRDLEPVRGLERSLIEATGNRNRTSWD